MASLSLSEIQDVIFASVAAEHSKRFDLKITMGVATEEALEDLDELRAHERLQWHANLKVGKNFSPASNPEHEITAVVYYGGPVDGYCCIGYALGCINAEGTAVEITHMEKRRDAGSEWCSKFLPLIVDAVTSYSLYLNSAKLANICKLALVGPLPGVRKYYQEQGFEYFADYLCTDAMVKFIDQ
ncbi:hypothetical protein U2G54_000996 [Vibrio fluvialis]|nr:hypothetical protein [Vibrio fluvialis]EMA2479583.1 hypothetical protein [Vibrio fluvialis]